MPDTPGIDDGSKRLFVAPDPICDWTQNLINHIDEHAHLKEAVVLVLIRVDPGDKKKMDKGELIVAGKAAMASAKMKLLIASDKDVAAVNFTITLSAHWLLSIGLMDEEFGVIAEDLATIALAMGLIDHELLHCGAKVIGQFIKLSLQAEFIKGEGGRVIEVCKDIVNDDGDELVRYYEIKDKKFIWKMRPHDIQEFNGIAARWGARSRQLGRLVDEIKKSDPGLFDKAVA
jgi:hypothetical protein